MNSAIGFTAIRRGSNQVKARAKTAQQKTISHFPDFSQRSLQIGETTLEYWGRGELKTCTHVLPDTSTLLLVGSPVGNHSWETVEKQILRCERLSDFRIPWDGRVNLLHISADGKTWTLWNDFVGAIPVYYSQSEENRVASTLETVVVEANNHTKDDFHFPAVVVFLIHGHFFGDWTLYKDIKKGLPDCVIEWTDHGIHSTHCETIFASEGRCEEGWDNLIDELYSLLKNTIGIALRSSPTWLLPLSSGMDSRMIAAMSKVTGPEVKAFTWGSSNTKDVVFSRRIAQALEIPWQRVDIGTDYLAQDLPLWRDLFGSALHFHGMYQIPFYNALKALPPAPIASGFLNDVFSGIFTGTHPELYKPNHGMPYSLPESWMLWKAEELRELFRFPVDEAIETVAHRIEEELDFIQGHWYQKLNILTLRGRQHHFTYFQSTMCDYWRGVSTPYLNREYANFWLSLPRTTLDHRRLLVEMAKRKFASVMGIPGTFSKEPAILTGSYLAKRRIAKMLPDPLASRLMPEFSATKGLKTDVASLKAGGKQAIWPIPEARPLLDEWIKLDQVDKVYQEALAGDIRAVRKIQTIQTLAYRMIG